MNDKKANTYGCIMLIAMIAGIYIFFTIAFSSSSTPTSESNEPTDVEIVSYAQTVLDDNLTNPKYAYGTSDYTVIGTGLRYKIEGKVNSEKFWMIIQFVDESYKEYDLISLQVGDNIIYKK